MSAADLVGFAAGTLTTIAFLPQVVKTWRSGSAGDLSLGMLVAFTLGVALWTVYGVMIDHWPVIVPNLLTLVLCGLILAFKIRDLGR